MMTTLFCLMLSMLAPPPLRAQSPAAPAPGDKVLQDIHALMLERQMEDRLRETLRFEMGTPEVLVLARIRLVEQPARTVEEDPDEEITPSGNLLPGVPADRGLPNAVKKKRIHIPGRMLLVKHITVLLGADVAKPLAQKAKDRSVELLGLDLVNGDTITVEFGKPTAAAKKKKEMEERSTWTEFYRSPYMLAGGMLFVLFAVFSLFLFRSARASFRELITNLAAIPKAVSGAGGGGGGGGGGGRLELPEGAITAAAAQGGTRYMAFVNRGNLERFQNALPDLGPREISVALQCLSERLAAAAFAALPTQTQGEVLMHSREIRHEDPREVEKIEEKLRTAMGFGYGGIERMSLLLQRSDQKTQDKIMDWLKEKDSELAKNLSDNLFDFMEVLYYDQKSIQRIYREIGSERFVRLLEPLDQKMRTDFYDKLNPEIVTLLEERLQVIPQVTTDAWQEEALEAFKSIEKLGAQGIIAPFSKISRKRNPEIR